MFVFVFIFVDTALGTAWTVEISFPITTQSCLINRSQEFVSRDVFILRLQIDWFKTQFPSEGTEARIWRIKKNYKTNTVYFGSTPNLVTVANEGLHGSPIKNAIVPVVTVARWGVDSKIYFILVFLGKLIEQNHPQGQGSPSINLIS